MPPKRQTPPWPAKPHTLAKIEILRGFLNAWFHIFGQTPSMAGRDLLYVDGFAGPGYYVNKEDGTPVRRDGSPIASMTSASTALSSTNWRAGRVHCAFVEERKSTLDHLKDHVGTFDFHSWVRPNYYHGSFEAKFAALRADFPGHVNGPLPLMLFLDPFGATGVPFSIVKEVLGYDRTDLLVNLDADGISRNLRAGQEGVVSSVFGGQSWRAALPEDVGFRDGCLRIVDHYRAQLHDVAGARYTFPFEMKTALRKPGDVGYFLIFASRHRRGLEKMKEAMKAIDQTGQYIFSNAWAGQGVLLREDHLSEFCRHMRIRFEGRQVSYDELNDFALNETPYLNPKRMLALLEDQERIRVAVSDTTRRRRQFPEDKIHYIEFLKED